MGSTKFRTLRNWNVNLPTGTLYGRDQAFNIQASGQLSNAAAYRSAVVAYRNGAPVRLEQVANVIDSVEDDKRLVVLQRQQGGRPAINLMVMRQPGSNTIEVTDAIKKLLPEFQASCRPRSSSRFAATARRPSARPSTTSSSPSRSHSAW